MEIDASSRYRQGFCVVNADTLKVYQRGDKFLVLNPLIPSWIVTNINGVLLLKLYGNLQEVDKTVQAFKEHTTQIPAHSCESFLEKIQEARLFDSSAASYIHKPYQLDGVYLNMTRNCNLHCIYCFAASRKESSDSDLDFNDYVRILTAIKKYNSAVTIIFTGGEPLLSKLTIPVAEYAKSLGFTRKLLTNGTLISESNIQEIVASFDSFKISLDGSSESSHDYYRGNGTYNKTVNAIRLLDEHKADVSLAMVVTQKNKNEISAMTNRWGNRLVFQPLFPLGNARSDKSLYLTGKEYYDVLTADSNIVPYDNINSVIALHKNNQSILKCAMGDGEVSISASGDLYPCQLLHDDDFKIGNLKESSFDDLYNSPKMEKFKFHTVEKIKKCNVCDFRLLCGGSCQARHYSENGTIDEAGDFCEYEKCAIVDGLIKSSKIREL